MVEEIGSLKIFRILHAGYVFECGKTRIMFDPIFENPFSRNCYAFPNVKFDYEKIRNLKLDAIFISHFHDDHCSLESLNYLDRNIPIYMFCVFEEIFALIKKLGFKKVFALKLDELVQVGDIKIISRRALDEDVDSIFHIFAAGVQVLNVVDSWIGPSTLELLRQTAWDLILWPFQTMREIEVLAPSRAEPASSALPPEWIEQLKVLRPKYIVPSSCQFQQETWSWYNHALFPISYKKFELEINSILPKTEVIRLNPGVSVAFKNQRLELSSPLTWIYPVGDQDVDYDYQPQLKPLTTSEIAKNFLALSELQTQRVWSFCQKEILEKYKSLNEVEDKFFQKSRLWQLSIYDHLGLATNFYYHIEKESLNIASADLMQIAWTTEIPISKLYAGLELGESLTSMYIRINDFIFSPEIEKEIEFVDVIDDPLIRCLFSQLEIGSYQATQLKHLQRLQHLQHL